MLGSEIETKEAGDIQPQGRRAARLLSLCRQAAPKYGSQSFPVMTSAPNSGMVMEGSVLGLADAAFANPAPVATPHQGQTRASFTLLSLVQGQDVFSALVDESLRVAMQDLMAGQLLIGTGVSPSLTGLVNVSGIGTSSYMSTNRGAASGFREGENVLEDATYGPEIRPTWIVASSLYREARETLREPGGTGDYVIRDGRVLGEIPALKSSELEDNQALLVDLGYVVVAIWDTLDLTLDMVTKPGNMLITLTSWFDVVPIRKEAILLMDQA